MDGFLLDGSEKELKTNILVKVPITNFAAKTKKIRRASVEIISLMNPDIIDELQNMR